MPPTDEARDRAPLIPAGLDWLTAGKAPALEDLRGRVVLLAFWTASRADSVSALADLRRLSAAHPDTLVVLGIHTAKFPHERTTDALRRSVGRLGIEFPVANDRDHRIRQAYGVKTVPMFILIDPGGRIVGGVTGGGHFDLLDGAVAAAVAEHSARGMLLRSPAPAGPAAEAPAGASPDFPSGLLAGETGRLLYIAEPRRRRILVTDFEGRIREVIGSGREGSADGPFAEVEFHAPHALACSGDRLYISDAGNHTIREADLKTRTVRSIAGTGRPGNSRGGRHDALSLALSTPLGLAADDEDRLHVAMAGTRQIWSLDLPTGKMSPLAGTGAESLADGPGPGAAFGQPEGLSLDGRHLYVADGGASAIRVVNIRTGGVTTLVGEGLFEFGDQDGTGAEVRLQRPLAVLALGDFVYVADTCNHKIRRLDPKTRECRTIAGDGIPGREDGTPGRFNAPSGLAAAGGRIYVADTDNHAVRILDPGTGRVSTLVLIDRA